MVITRTRPGESVKRDYLPPQAKSIFACHPREENPELGLRGLVDETNVSLTDPDDGLDGHHENQAWGKCKKRLSAAASKKHLCVSPQGREPRTRAQGSCGRD